VWTGSSKAFEALYVLWMYMLTQKAVQFDSIGMMPESPWYLYAPLALILRAFATWGRRWQIQGRW
jgi:hypothetical protein